MVSERAKDMVDALLKRLNAEQLSKELRSTAPFLLPFLKMTCIYFVLWLDKGSFPAACIKCLPLLSLIWFVCLLGVSDSHVHRYNRRVVAGLAWCCVGDFFLVWSELNEFYFLAGLFCFAVGHLVYSFAFGWTPVGVKEFIFIFVIGAPVITGIASCVDGMLRYATVVYGVLLLVMDWRALARFNLQGEVVPWRKIYAAVGATLFVVSDTVLAVDKFCSPVAGERYIVMTTYFAAQLFIALSVVNSGLAKYGGVVVGDQKNQNFHSIGMSSDQTNGGVSDDVIHQKLGTNFHLNREDSEQKLRQRI